MSVRRNRTNRRGSTSTRGPYTRHPMGGDMESYRAYILNTGMFPPYSGKLGETAEPGRRRRGPTGGGGGGGYRSTGFNFMIGKKV